MQNWSIKFVSTFLLFSSCRLSSSGLTWWSDFRTSCTASAWASSTGCCPIRSGQEWGLFILGRSSGESESHLNKLKKTKYKIIRRQGKVWRNHDLAANKARCTIFQLNKLIYLTRGTSILVCLITLNERHQNLILFMITNLSFLFKKWTVPENNFHYFRLFDADDRK